MNIRFCFVFAILVVIANSTTLAIGQDLAADATPTPTQTPDPNPTNLGPDVLPISAQDADPAVTDDVEADLGEKVEAVEDADETEAAKQTPINEQTIYIPYEKLQEVFEKEGRGVFLPYKKFQQLWDAAKANQEPRNQADEDLGAFINEISSEATIGHQVVNVNATLVIDVLSAGWNEIPLRLNGAAIRSAKIGDNNALIVYEPKVGYKLLYKKTGKEPEKIQLNLLYSKAYQKTPGQSRVEFQAPQAPVNRWRVRIDQAGVKVDIQPMVAATEEMAGDDAQPEEETVILAFVAAAPSVRIAWNPKSEGASGLTAFATVQSEQQIVIDEGIVRTRTQLVYEISRSTISQLNIEIPADQKVVNVFDRNVKKWDVQTNDGVQTVVVDLFEPEGQSQSILIELEKFVEDKSQQNLELPTVKAQGVARQQGVVVVQLGKGLSAEATTRSGLLQLDHNDLPAALKNSAWAFSYRYASMPYSLELSVEKVLPQIVTDELVEAELMPNSISVNWQIKYSVKRAGVFQFRLNIPEIYNIQSVVGKSLNGANPAVVDTYHLEGESKSVWVVNLSRKAIDEVALLVRLRRSLDEPDLVAPTGNSATISLPIPRVMPEGVEFSNGNAAVRAPESLRVNPESVTGLRTISFSEVYSKVPSHGAMSSSARPILAYAFSQGEASIELDVLRRRPQVNVDQILTAEVESGVVKFDAKFFYDVRYSGVKSFRIDLPSDVATKVRNQNTAMRISKLDPQPEEVAEGYEAWSVAGQSEFLGSTTVHLAWEDKIEELTVGSEREIKLHRLAPVDVDRAQGQIVVIKSESIDIQPTGVVEGLQPIDPQNDLKHGQSHPNAALAFEFVDAWEISLQAIRFDIEETKQTSIDRAVVRMVALPNGEISVQALFRVKSSQQRLSVQMPIDAKFDSQPLQINGQIVTLEGGAHGEIFVPLVGLSSEQASIVDLRYAVAGTAAELVLPEFPDDPAVQKVFLATYLSPKLALLGSHGDWNQTALVKSNRVWNESDEISSSDSGLNQWLVEGTNVSQSQINSFKVGQNERYVFSALRPATGPEGALSLVTLNENLLHAIVFLVVAGVGLPLYGRSLGLQVSAIATLVTLLILFAVFAPIAADQIFDQVLWLAIAVVALAWTVGYARKLQKGLGVHLSRAENEDAVADQTAPEPCPDDSPEESRLGMTPISHDDAERVLADQASPPDGSEGGEFVGNEKVDESSSDASGEGGDDDGGDRDVEDRDGEAKEGSDE